MAGPHAVNAVRARRYSATAADLPARNAPLS